MTAKGLKQSLLKKDRITGAAVIALISCVYAPAGFANAASDLLDKALAGDHRDPANVARDIYRHPKETLLFLGWQPDMTVVEIWPGRGWYTEVLAPITREQGILYTAGFAMTSDRAPGWRRKMQKEFA
ncbi:MAG: hypothetical protein MI673_06635, partial [Thiotrichales bacterium]|nr:hypothetical protein [Thiotrichales bacterium]